MGLVLSLLFPEIKTSASSGTTQADSKKSESGEFKYLERTGPPSVLGPTPGNIPQKHSDSKMLIRPPSDKEKRVRSDSSAYDTISMTPDVDWEKKDKK